jgi:hypothetical protein
VDLLWNRNVRQVDIALVRALIPPEHGVDCCAELDAVGLVDAAGVHPKVSQSISRGLLRAELYLLPPGLAHSLACVLSVNHWVRGRGNLCRLLLAWPPVAAELDTSKRQHPYSSPEEHHFFGWAETRLGANHSSLIYNRNAKE